jgi:osmotically-inducible protein OsmY
MGRYDQDRRIIENHVFSYENRLFGMLMLVIFIGVVLPGVAHTMTDFDIETAVDMQLIKDDIVQAQRIDVESDQGIVTLSGTIDRLGALERAASIAMTVKGVRAVVNNLEMVPTERSDQQILEDIRQALKLDPVAAAREIDVEVREARAFLSGRVESWQENNLIEKCVKRVRGVRDIVNNMEVHISSQRTDGEIESEVRKRLEWDVWVEASRIDIEVANGQVNLTGIVGSLAEKERASEKAWVPGVQSVDAKDLAVDWELHQHEIRTKPKIAYADREVKAAVEDALMYDPRVGEGKIDVRVQNGVVTLKGTVKILSESKAAEQDALNTVGVWMVKNRIKVRPDMLTDYASMLDHDREIAEQVRLALLLDPAVQQHKISVSVNNYLVVLEGRVDSEYARKRAAEVAAGIRGVTMVHNKLTKLVEPKEMSMEDWQLRQEILSELEWSPFVDGTGVSVEVEDGVAVLTGIVEDLRARRVATQNAFEGGAVQVQNHLKVRQGPHFLQP